MRKTLVWAAAATMMCGSIWADVCSDLRTQYSNLIDRLSQETQAALAQTTDAAEQQAIRDSFNAQKAAAEAERDSVLLSAGCIEAPPTGGTDPGTGTTPPTTGGTDPGVGGTDPGTGGTTPGSGDDQTCTELKDQVRTQAKILAATKGRGAAATYVRSRKAEIEAACGNYGRGRCDIGGMGKDDHDKCDKDRKPDCKPTPKCDPQPKCDPKPKCEPKPKCDTHKKCTR